MANENKMITYPFNKDDIRAIAREEVRNNGDVVAESLKNEDVKVKSIEQSQANLSYSFELTPKDSTNFEVSGQPFARIEKINGVMYIIYSARFHNKDENNQHAFRFAQVDINVPEEIGKFIYDVNGNDLTHQSSAPITGGYIAKDGASTLISFLRLSHASANTLNIYDSSTINCSANGYISVSFRLFLTLV